MAARRTPDLARAARLLEPGVTAAPGLVTDQCVSTCAPMAANLGYGGFVVGDACAAFAMTGPDGVEIPAETIHRAHLATLHVEFLPVHATAAVLAGLAGA